MRILDYKTKDDLLNELTKRIKTIDQRERIVLKFPFAHQFNRIEFYCSETEVKGNGYLGGKTFQGVFSIQVFLDYGNKPTDKSSYSYENEFFNFLPTLVDKIYKTIEVVN